MKGRRCCKSCRYWDAHSCDPDEKLGDCRHRNGHYYARVPFGDSFAMIDTWGTPETPPGHVCEQWESALEPPP